MATLPQLIAALQKHDGRDLGTITQFGRMIREAGYLPGGKRGAGAPKMTFGDAAVLILGLYGSSSPAAAPGYIAKMRTLAPDEHVDTAHEIPPLTCIEGAENLLDALAILIEVTPGLVVHALTVARQAASDGMVQRSEQGRTEVTQAQIERAGNAYMAMVLRGEYLRFEVVLQRDLASMRILTDNPKKIVWERRFVLDTELLNSDYYTDALSRPADRRTVVTFGLPTLMAAWVAVSGADDEEVD